MANSPLAWVTGAGGLIGNYLVQLAPRYAPAWRVRGLRRADIDLTDFTTLQRLYRQDRPQLIIHCAALSRSPDCEAHPEWARRLNVEVTRQLAELGAEAPFVWFSTDLVFDGRQGSYTEEATPNPLSVYAETKHAAEQVILAHPHALVIRTSLNGGTSPTGDRGFNEQMRRAWRAGQLLRLFTDEFRSPLPASATAQAVWELVQREARGIYHVAGAERLSRWEIGQLVAARCPELSPRLAAASLQEYAGAPRPPDTSLDCTKAQQRLSFPLPGLRTWLAAHPEILFDSQRSSQFTPVFAMKIETMHIGQRVRHPQYGPGTVRALCELTATVAFDNGTRQEVAPDLSGLAPAEAHATLSYLETPLVTLLRDTVEATLARLGVERPDQVVERLGARWRGGRLVLHPADPALQTKEVGLEVFFHKIVMVRNNLRVLEQKLNASENLSAAEKFDWQQYITRCYGSLTTFNVLFKEKEDQF